MTEGFVQGKLKAVTAPGAGWKCRQCLSFLKTGEAAVKIGKDIYCIECAREGVSEGQLHCKKCGKIVAPAVFDENDGFCDWCFEIGFSEEEMGFFDVGAKRAMSIPE